MRPNIHSLTCRLRLVALWFGIAFIAPLQADILTLPATEPLLTNLTMPPRGAHQRTVLRQLGEPQKSAPAIGDPPISRWYYPNFTVYFEGAYVIHSVPATVHSEPSR
ncbi:MAG: phosphodiesterase [Gammaproteobacteria bacterium]|nr:phosphodiesterase [Gammaproteobacteria bacterium]